MGNVSIEAYALRHVVLPAESSSTTPSALRASRASSAAAQSLLARASLRFAINASMCATSSSA